MITLPAEFLYPDVLHIEKKETIQYSCQYFFTYDGKYDEHTHNHMLYCFNEAGAATILREAQDLNCNDIDGNGSAFSR